MDNDETPAPGDKKANRRKLKEQIDSLKMDRRVGKYVGDPENKHLGIFKAPADEQKTYRKSINEKIKGVRGQL